MKLATSTGDFSHYINLLPEKIKIFKDAKFKYLNLEFSSNTQALYCENDYDWKKLANELGNVADYAGVKYVVAHAPCLNVFNKESETVHKSYVLAIRNSIEMCHILGIQRIVVHTGFCDSFTFREFYKNNKQFYSEFFDLMEKYNITVMTENWDTVSFPFSTGKELREFVEYINHPLLGVCWDTAHGNINVKAREMGQYKNIIDIGDKIKGVHISDNFGDTHHHTWPFAGIINFDSIMQGLLDVGYDGYFTFEASYTLLHKNNPPYTRKSWEYNGKIAERLLNPSIELKKQAVNLLYDIGKYILDTYNCFEK